MSIKDDPPAAPDPAKTAQAQGAANVETARAQAALNNVSQYGPTGSAVYTKLPGDQYRLDTTLSPNQQQLLTKGEELGIGARDLAVGQLGRIEDAVAQPFNYEGLPAAPQADEAARSRVVSDIMSRMDPQFDRDRAALESRLASQGINLGSQAYSQGMDELGRNRNDARIQADLAGLAEMQGMFNMGSAARNQGIQERAYARAQPINEAAALMGTGQQVQMPQFGGTPQTGVAATDVTGPIMQAYNAKMAQWNAQNQATNAALGGLFGLGGAALGNPGIW